MLKEKTPEEKILNMLGARRRRNGTPSYANPDMYEIKICQEWGIDIDFDPKTEVEPREDYKAKE